MHSRTVKTRPQAALQKNQLRPVTRRSFVKSFLAAGAAANVAGLNLAAEPDKARAAEISRSDANFRRAEAYRIRMNAARLALQRGIVLHPTNGDEDRYPNQIGSFTKALPHNALGEVDPNAYQALL